MNLKLLAVCIVVFILVIFKISATEETESAKKPEVYTKNPNIAVDFLEEMLLRKWELKNGDRKIICTIKIEKNQWIVSEEIKIEE
jgi:hypothetical protein